MASIPKNSSFGSLGISSVCRRRPPSHVPLCVFFQKPIILFVAAVAAAVSRRTVVSCEFRGTVCGGRPRRRRVGLVVPEPHQFSKELGLRFCVLFVRQKRRRRPPLSPVQGRWVNGIGYGEGAFFWRVVHQERVAGGPQGKGLPYLGQVFFINNAVVMPCIIVIEVSIPCLVAQIGISFFA